jgi:hypothetical protein
MIFYRTAIAYNIIMIVLCGSVLQFIYIVWTFEVQKIYCNQKEGGRQNNQLDNLYGLHKVKSSEILKQTTTPDLFTLSSSQNIPVYIRLSLNIHSLYSYKSAKLMAEPRTHTLHSQKKWNG